MPKDTLPEYTPEEKARIYAKFKAEFTADDLADYIEDDDEKYSMETVLVELEAMVLAAKTPKGGKLMASSPPNESFSVELTGIARQ